MKRTVQHESYNDNTIDYDFALLELSEPLSFNDQIQAVALPNVDTEIEDGRESYVSGWGK